MSLTATWQLGFPSSLPRVDVASCSIRDVALPRWSLCDGGGRPTWWVVGIMGGGVEEAKVATRWGCMGIVDDDGGGRGTRERWINDG